MPKIIWKEENAERIAIYVTEPHKDGTVLEIETTNSGFQKYSRRQAKELADSIYTALEISPAKRSD